MDLYSIEKTKDYTFFKIVYYYYQLTPRTIRIIKTVGLLMLLHIYLYKYIYSNNSSILFIRIINDKFSQRNWK